MFRAVWVKDRVEIGRLLEVAAFGVLRPSSPVCDGAAFMEWEMGLVGILEIGLVHTTIFSIELHQG